MQVTGTWLAAFAIALHALWPLIANARPQSVVQVPVCTVEGVTHYIELPGGKSPLERSSSAYHEHCSFCFLGERLALPSSFHFLEIADLLSTPVPSADGRAFTPHLILKAAARAPPVSPWCVSLDHAYGRFHEKALDTGRAVRADHGGRLVRLGVLHG